MPPKMKQPGAVVALDPPAVSPADEETNEDSLGSPGIQQMDNNKEKTQGEVAPSEQTGDEEDDVEHISRTESPTQPSAQTAEEPDEIEETQEPPEATEDTAAAKPAAKEKQTQFEEPAGDTDGQGEDRPKPKLTFKQKCGKMGRKLFDPKKKTCLGRRGKEWLVTCIWLPILYAFTVATTGGLVYTMYTVTDQIAPVYLLSSSFIGDNPTLSTFPRVEQVKNSYYLPLNSSVKYGTVLAKYLSDNYLHEDESDLFTSCRSPPGRDDIKSCHLDVTSYELYGPCRCVLKDPASKTCNDFPNYKNGELCVMIKINQIINFEPNYFDLEDDNHARKKRAGGKVASPTATTAQNATTTPITTPTSKTATTQNATTIRNTTIQTSTTTIGQPPEKTDAPLTYATPPPGPVSHCWKKRAIVDCAMEKFADKEGANVSLRAEYLDRTRVTVYPRGGVPSCFWPYKGHSEHPHHRPFFIVHLEHGPTKEFLIFQITCTLRSDLEDDEKKHLKITFFTDNSLPKTATHSKKSGTLNHGHGHPH